MVRATFLAFCLLGALFLVMPAAAYPRYLGNYYRPGVQYEPEQIIDMLNRLNELMEMERKMENSEKRALDMGLNRGYSGALHAKHLMGMAAANYASGPGRRRRDVE